jgi:hypothetical protein
MPVLFEVNALMEFMEGKEECKLDNEEARSFSVPARGRADVGFVLVEGEDPATRFKPRFPEAASVADRGLVTPKPVFAAGDALVEVAFVLIGVRGNFHPLCSFCFSG